METLEVFLKGSFWRVGTSQRVLPRKMGVGRRAPWASSGEREVLQLEHASGSPGGPQESGCGADAQVFCLGRTGVRPKNMHF